MKAFAPILTVALAAALAGTPRTLVAQQPTAQPAPANPVEAQLIAAEHGAWTAWVNKDTTAFIRDIDRKSVMVDMMGRNTLNLGEVAKGMATCQLTGHNLDSFQTTQVTPDVVVLSYKATVQGTCNGQKVPDVWATSTYVKRGGKWIAVYHTETPLMTTTGG